MGRKTISSELAEVKGRETDLIVLLEREKGETARLQQMYRDLVMKHKMILSLLSNGDEYLNID